MKNTINGIDVDAFQQFAEGVSQNPNTSKASFNVETRWAGQTRSVEKHTSVISILPQMNQLIY